MTIPNSLNFTIAALFFVFAIIKGLPLAVVAEHTIAAVVITALALHYVGAGGVAKLIGATVLWLGWLDGLLLAGAASALVLAWYPIHRHLLQRKGDVPYLPAHVLALAVALASGWITLPLA